MAPEYVFQRKREKIENLWIFDIFIYLQKDREQDTGINAAHHIFSVLQHNQTLHLNITLMRNA